MRRALLAALVLSATALADQREAYVILEGGVGVQLLTDAATGKQSTLALLPAAELQGFYGLTNWVHLGLYCRGFVASDFAIPDVQPTMTDGSTPTGTLYENFHGVGGGILVRLRVDTGIALAPFAQLELGATWARFESLQLFPTGRDFALAVPMRDIAFVDGRGVLGLELRLVEHLLLELVVGARRALTPYIPWQFDAGLAAGAVW